MKLVASLIVRNELGRYLEPCIAHLLDFCDEIRVLNDGSSDGSDKWLVERSDRITVADLAATTFFEHEGRSRQILLEWTLDASPTHVLAIDADEFVSDGRSFRRMLERQPQQNVWSLTMEEIWELDGDCLCVREDGGWRAHEVQIAWRVVPGRQYLIRDRQLACGRIPASVGSSARRTGLSALHFGWTNEAERQARHHRYAVNDNGRFHARQHLDSILWTDDRVQLRGRRWPSGLVRAREAISARAGAVIA